MAKYLIKGWVEVEVFAEVEAKNLVEVKQILKKANGSGLPDEFSWNDGDWVSKVTVESIERVKKIKR